MLKRELDAESNGTLPHLFIPSKIATLVPQFAVEELLLDRTANSVPAFAVKGLPLMMMMMMIDLINLFIHSFIYLLTCLLN